jgi:hypothetical protein
LAAPKSREASPQEPGGPGAEILKTPLCYQCLRGKFSSWVAALPRCVFGESLILTEPVLTELLKGNSSNLDAVDSAVMEPVFHRLSLVPRGLLALAEAAKMGRYNSWRHN